MNDSSLPREEKCPRCGETVSIINYNPGSCHGCGYKYQFKTVQGFEGAESSEGPHDGVCWG